MDGSGAGISTVGLALCHCHRRWRIVVNSMQAEGEAEAQLGACQAGENEPRRGSVVCQRPFLRPRAPGIAPMRTASNNILFYSFKIYYNQR